MSVEQIDKVDFISTTEKGIIRLTISDYLEWDSKNEHLLILQNKINAYLNFIESGQIFEEYPSSANKKIEIDIFNTKYIIDYKSLLSIDPILSIKVLESP